MIDENILWYQFTNEEEVRHIMRNLSVFMRAKASYPYSCLCFSR